MKFKKGDKVCAVLVANRWGVDFTCYVGTLEKVTKAGPHTNPTATIMAKLYIGLNTKQKHDPRQVTVDAKVFKLLPWNDEVKAKINELRTQSQVLHVMTLEVKEYGRG